METNKMNENMRMERAMFLMSLFLDRNKLSKTPTLEAEINSTAIKFGLSTGGRERRLYAVAIVKCEDKDELLKNPDELLLVGEDIFGKKYLCGGVYSGGRLLYLISGSPDSMRSQLYHTAQEVVRRIERMTMIRCSVGISGLIDSIINCDRAYDEAAFAIKYLPDRTGGVRFAEDVMESLELDHAKISYVVSRFDGLLKVGDRGDLEKFVEEIFSEESLQSMSRINADMMGIQLMYCINKAVYDVSDSPEADRFLKSQMIGPQTTADKEDIIRLCMMAKDIISNQRKQNAELLCDRAMHIIETDFGDETLSLAAISERLHVSPSYLSSILHKNRGDTFVNLLTGKRMASAKEYLLCTSMKVMEIARRCGYPDQHYFSYCFKRYYGTSPNKIRKNGSQDRTDQI